MAQAYVWRGWRRAALALCAAALLLSPRRPQEHLHLVILHTNDVHGQVLTRKATWLNRESPPDIGGIPRLAAAIARERAANPDAIVVDAGDWYQGTPEGSVERGLAVVRALAAIGFDAICPGNHEFDHGLANARRLIDQAGLPAILANVRGREGGARVDWAPPWRIIERKGIKIACVGLLTPTTPEITSHDLRAFDFVDPSVEFARAIQEIGPAADLVLPVGHIAVDESRALAKAHPDCPLIVSGHSHTYLKQGERVGACLIVQSGSKASALGRVDLWWDPAQRKVVRCEARLIDLMEPAPSIEEAEGIDARLARTLAICERVVGEAAAALNAVVGELAAPLTREVRAGCSTPGGWIADSLRRRMGSDVGVHNRGGTRCDLPAGPVTRRGLFELLPFDNDVVEVELSGADLLAVARRATESDRHTGLDFSGLKRIVRRGEGNARRLERVEVGGKPLDPTARYRVATNSFLANGGDGITEFEHAKSRRVDPILLREMMEAEFQRTPRVVWPDDAAQRYEEVGP